MSVKHIPLLTAYLFVSNKNSFDGLYEMIQRLKESGITVKKYDSKNELPQVKHKEPRIYVSVGSGWEEFQTLNLLPLHERKRWIHFHSPTDVQPYNLFYCWLNYTDPFIEDKLIPSTLFSSETPLVSIFTASYKSKEKILRPYYSLLKQTYSNWEWVIVDDSGDDDMTYNESLRNLKDPRVRRYRQDSRNGYIGAIKRYAAGLATGEILIELDHDDELTPDCLEKIVKAFQDNPDCGFAYGDCAEVYVGNHHAHWYGWDCGFGYSVYYRVWVHEMNRWQNVYKNTTINGDTIRHLVGLPNHPRAWTRDCYHLIGGHREELLVADDYDILLRTFLSTKYVAIPDLLYIQYRNENGDNSTFQRNKQIQILVQELERYYHNKINKKLYELDLPEQNKYSRIWEREKDDPAIRKVNRIHEDSSTISFLFPIPYSSSSKEYTQLMETLQKGIDTNFKEIEVVVVGAVPAEVETYAAQAPMGAIRWWPMEPNDSLETCIQYAKYCASSKEKVVMLP